MPANGPPARKPVDGDAGGQRVTSNGRRRESRSVLVLDSRYREVCAQIPGSLALGSLVMDN